jgi:hypothetical protein
MGNRARWARPVPPDRARRPPRALFTGFPQSPPSPHVVRRATDIPAPSNPGLRGGDTCLERGRARGESTGPRAAYRAVTGPHVGERCWANKITWYSLCRGIKKKRTGARNRVTRGSDFSAPGWVWVACRVGFLAITMCQAPMGWSQRRFAVISTPRLKSVCVVDSEGRVENKPC